MSSLVRAGVPFELGLQAVRESFSVRLESVVRELSERLERGVPLAEALGEESRIPPATRAVLVAALQSDAAADMLEEVAQLQSLMDQSLQDWRISFIYPCLVLLGCAIGAWWLASGFVPVLPDRTGVSSASQLQAVQWGRFLRWAAVAAGVCGFALTTALWRRESTWLWRWSGVGPRIESSRLASLLALLIRCQTPLPTAVRLAAAAATRASTRRSLIQLADEIETGSVRPTPQTTSAGSSFLIWLLRCGDGSKLSQQLHQLAEHQQRRADGRLRTVAAVLPLLLVGVLGGGFTLLYCLSLFGPLAAVWEQVSQSR